MVSPEGLTVPELDHMLVGEKLSNGASLYDEVWENIAPLSAGVYMIIDYLFGRSQQAYYWIALFIVFFQCYLFNRLLLNNKAFNENTYVPGLIYGLLMTYFFDFLTLTPTLMSQTFILLALNNIFNHIEFRAKRDEKILNIGIYLGLAALFYLPNMIFAISTLIIFAFFTGTVARRYLLMIFGITLPLAISAIYFLITDRLSEFIYSFINPFIALNKQVYFGWLDSIILFGLPLMLLLASFLRMTQRARFTNYQTRLIQAMFVWLVFAGLYILISNRYTPNIFVVGVSGLAFYFSHFLLLIRRKLVSEVVFGVFLIGVVSIVLGGHLGFYSPDELVNKEKYLITGEEKSLEGKKVLVLGEDLKTYVNCKPATPFLDWQMSRRLFMNLEYYDNQTIIYQGLINDPPEVIIDPNRVIPEIFNHMPGLASKYRKKGERYYLISS